MLTTRAINAEVKVIADTGIWHVEQINGCRIQQRRLVIYLFICGERKAPVQPVIYYPGIKRYL